MIFLLLLIGMKCVIFASAPFIVKHDTSDGEQKSKYLTIIRSLIEY